MNSILIHILIIRNYTSICPLTQNDHHWHKMIVFDPPIDPKWSSLVHPFTQNDCLWSTIWSSTNRFSYSNTSRVDHFPERFCWHWPLTIPQSTTWIVPEPIKSFLSHCSATHHPDVNQLMCQYFRHQHLSYDWQPRKQYQLHYNLFWNYFSVMNVYNSRYGPRCTSSQAIKKLSLSANQCHNWQLSINLSNSRVNFQVSVYSDFHSFLSHNWQTVGKASMVSGTATLGTVVVPLTRLPCHSSDPGTTWWRNRSAVWVDESDHMLVPVLS